MAFLHLVGGVKPGLTDPAHPRLALGWGKFSGTVRQAYPLLARPQYQAAAGSCGAHDLSFVLESDARHRAGAITQVCRMDVYRGARWLEGGGSEHVDAGIVMENGYRWLREYGTLSEARKAYNPAEVTTWAPDPSWAADRALWTADFQPLPIAVDPILAELEAGRCVSFSHLVYGQMESQAATTGVETGPDGGVVYGGHARCFCGFDLDWSSSGFGTGALLLRNWWKNWGVRHPLAPTDNRYAGMTDSFSWLPFSVINAPKFIEDAARLARGLLVEV